METWIKTENNTIEDTWTCLQQQVMNCELKFKEDLKSKLPSMLFAFSTDVHKKNKEKLELKTIPPNIIVNIPLDKKLCMIPIVKLEKLEDILKKNMPPPSRKSSKKYTKAVNLEQSPKPTIRKVANTKKSKIIVQEVNLQSYKNCTANTYYEKPLDTETECQIKGSFTKINKSDVLYPIDCGRTTNISESFCNDETENLMKNEFNKLWQEQEDEAKCNPDNGSCLKLFSETQKRTSKRRLSSKSSSIENSSTIAKKKPGVTKKRKEDLHSKDVSGNDETENLKKNEFNKFWQEQEDEAKCNPDNGPYLQLFTETQKRTSKRRLSSKSSSIQNSSTIPKKKQGVTKKPKEDLNLKDVSSSESVISNCKIFGRRSDTSVSCEMSTPTSKIKRTKKKTLCDGLDLKDVSSSESVTSDRKISTTSKITINKTQPDVEDLNLKDVSSSERVTSDRKISTTSKITINKTQPDVEDLNLKDVSSSEKVTSDRKISTTSKITINKTQPDVEDLNLKDVSSSESVLSKCKIYSQRRDTSSSLFSEIYNPTNKINQTKIKLSRSSIYTTKYLRKKQNTKSNIFIETVPRINSNHALFNQSSILAEEEIDLENAMLNGISNNNEAETIEITIHNESRNFVKTQSNENLAKRITDLRDIISPKYFEVKRPPGRPSSTCSSIKKQPIGSFPTFRSSSSSLFLPSTPQSYQKTNNSQPDDDVISLFAESYIINNSSPRDQDFDDISSDDDTIEDNNYSNFTAYDIDEQVPHDNCTVPESDVNRNSYLDNSLKTDSMERCNFQTANSSLDSFSKIIEPENPFEEKTYITDRDSSFHQTPPMFVSSSTDLHTIDKITTDSLYNEISNDIVVNSTKISSPDKTTQISQETTKDEFRAFFRTVCFRYLEYGFCLANHSEKHEIPIDYEIVLKKLLPSQISLTYNAFVCHYSFLLEKTIPKFAKLFGQYEDEDNLIVMVRHLQKLKTLKPEVKVNCMRSILDALNDFMEYHVAIDKIYEDIAKKDTVEFLFSTIDMLLELLLEGPSIENNWNSIKKLTSVDDYEIPLKIVETILLDCCKRSKIRKFHIKNVFNDIIKKIADVNLLKIQNKIIDDFVKAIENFGLNCVDEFKQRLTTCRKNENLKNDPVFKVPAPVKQADTNMLSPVSNSGNFITPLKQADTNMLSPISNSGNFIATPVSNSGNITASSVSNTSNSPSDFNTGNFSVSPAVLNSNNLIPPLLSNPINFSGFSASNSDNFPVPSVSNANNFTYFNNSNKRHSPTTSINIRDHPRYEPRSKSMEFRRKNKYRKKTKMDNRINDVVRDLRNGDFMKGLEKLKYFGQRSDFQHIINYVAKQLSTETAQRFLDVFTNGSNYTDISKYKYHE